MVVAKPSAATATRPLGAGNEPEGTRIDLDDVAKRYRVGDVTVTALEGVNLHVDETAFVVILGPSGSGKTTLLNLIGALDVPTVGSVRIAGTDITTTTRSRRFAFRRRTVSFIFQTFNLFPALTALENVQFGADVAGRDHAIAVSDGRPQGAVLALALLIAFNSTSITVDERAREHATMFAYGVPVRTILRMSVIESVLTGLLGTAAGIGAGYVVLRWIVEHLMPSTLPEIGMHAFLAPTTVGNCDGVGGTGGGRDTAAHNEASAGHGHPFRTAGGAMIGIDQARRQR